MCPAPLDTGLRRYDGYVKVSFCGNDHCLVKATNGDENGLAPVTGNHEGCPYDWFVGAYFQRNDDSSWDDDEIPMIVSSA